MADKYKIDKDSDDYHSDDGNGCRVSGKRGNAESDQADGETEPDELSDLRQILAEQTHLFSCGGIIPIVENASVSSLNFAALCIADRENPQKNNGNNESSRRADSQNAVLNIMTDPVTVRWDVAANASGSTSCAKCTFPLGPGGEANLDKLISCADAATFGRDGQDVYDDTYRKAVKMNPAVFCSNFNPYELGIIDTIAQVLLPNVCSSTTHRAVRAELYALNVYSSPSGMFKPHVDTPRSPAQFGSLVVCLPVEHGGGQLKVRYKSKEMTFDWSTSREEPDHSTIRWAAFYSDCEHEVLEVTSGHRLTLTYNLYAVRGAGRLTGVCPTLDPTQIPLYQAIVTTLSKDPFKGKGGTLGVHCSHVYPFNYNQEAPLPDILKGVDAMLWETFRALGHKPRIAPVLEINLEQYDDLLYDYCDRHPEPPTSDVAAHALWVAGKPTRWVIGRKFGVDLDHGYVIESSKDYIGMLQCWGEWDQSGIHWLTNPGTTELQLVHAAYGNYASVETVYAASSILIEILSTSENDEKTGD